MVQNALNRVKFLYHYSLKTRIVESASQFVLFLRKVQVVVVLSDHLYSDYLRKESDNAESYLQPVAESGFAAARLVVFTRLTNFEAAYMHDCRTPCDNLSCTCDK